LEALLSSSSQAKPSGPIAIDSHQEISHWDAASGILLVELAGHDATLSPCTGLFCTMCHKNLEAFTVAVASFGGQVAPYIDFQPIVGQEVIRAAEMELKNPSRLGHRIETSGRVPQ
jgi:hypothetical protein